MKKTILVIGATPGFGKDIAFELSRLGHRVIATLQKESEVENLIGEAKKENILLTVNRLNLLNSTDREVIYGKYEIDILLYNEHLVESAPISGQPIELIRSMFEYNVFGILEIAHYFIRGFIARKAGKIIFTSSLGNLGGMPYFSAYCASKYALDIIALGLREELWPFGIHVSNIDVSVFKEIKHHIGDLLSYD